MRNLFIIIVIIALCACESMDANYKAFLEDGPIVYIAKVNADSVKIYPGRERLAMSWAKPDDPRAKKAMIAWANKTQTIEVDINQNGETYFIIDDLNEGSYIFEITFSDDVGNNSLTVSVTGDTYGRVYEKYLINRTVSDIVWDNDQATITFEEKIDETMIGWKLDWEHNDKKTAVFIDASSNEAVFDNFIKTSFRYCSAYMPAATAIDTFYSSCGVHAPTISVDDIELEKDANDVLKVVFPGVDDAHYAGLEIGWTQNGVTYTHILEAGSTTAYLDNFQAVILRFRAMYNYDDAYYYSGYTNYEVLSAEYLDRTGWIVTTSHVLPVDAAISNAHGSLIDGDETTCLSMVKPGKTYGGITVAETEEVFVILDMQSIRQVDFFYFLHRNNANINLRVHGVSLYGSNDGVNFETIKEDISLPGATDSTVPDCSVDIPSSNYRYLKVRYTQWVTTSNTMQVAEFKPGAYVVR